MPKFLSFVLLAVLFLIGCDSKKETTVSNEQSKLLRLNAMYDSALVHKDTGFLKRIYADDFIYTAPDGKVLNKEQQIISVAVSEINIDTGSSEDVKIKFYNNTAVMTGAFKASGTYRANPVTRHERYTTVWIRKDSSWVIVAEQGNILAN